MKRLLLASLVLLVANQASAALIARWTFETSPPADLNNSTTIGGILADAGIGTASGVHASAATDWSTPVGNGSGNSLSSNEWAVGDYYQFAFNAAGLTNLQLNFDQTSSNTGPRDFKVQTTLDGTLFTDLVNYVVLANAAPNPFWTSATSSPIFSFAISLPNNIVGIRLVDRSAVSAEGGAVAAGGTSRVDNVSINTVPEPSTFVFFSFAVVGFGGAALRRTQSRRRTTAAS